MKWQDVNIHPKNCGFVYWPQGHVIPRNWFRSHVQEFDLWLFTEGNGRIKSLDHQEWKLQRGSVVLLRPGREYEAFQSPKEPRIGTFWFHFELLPAQYPPGKLGLRNLPFYHETRDIGFLEFVARKIVFLMRECWDCPATKNILEREEAGLLLKTLLMEIYREAKLEGSSPITGVDLRHQQSIERMVSLIYESPEKYSTVSQLATPAGYSTDHFSRLFRRFTGRSPMALLIDARMDKAKKLLRSSDLNIGQVADLLAFRDIYSFSRQFRKHVGISPLTYRQNDRKSGR